MHGRSNWMKKNVNIFRCVKYLNIRQKMPVSKEKTDFYVKEIETHFSCFIFKVNDKNI